MNASDPLTRHMRLTSGHQKALSSLGITTVKDLLLHLPTRYEDISTITAIGNLSVGSEAVVYGKISGLKTRKTWRGRRPIAEGWIEDGSARMKVIWFNQPYIAKMLPEGGFVKLAGKVAGTAEKPYLSNPESEKLTELPIDRHDSLFMQDAPHDATLFPVYRETKGVTSKWIYHTIQKCFKAGALDTLEDPLPSAMIARYHLPSLTTALQWIHAPRKIEHTEAARKRFAFEEVFYIQIAAARERAAVAHEDAYKIRTDKAHIRAYTERFPFPLTSAQERVIVDICKDFAGDHPMSRLLEGDVGSGKTAVAATAAYAVATSHHYRSKASHALMPRSFGNLQVAYMAPTEILAKQHFENFIGYFRHLPIQIGLITGSGCMKFPSKVNPDTPTTISRKTLLTLVQRGEIPILIGTHALIQKSVSFKHLALVIIDEQHRFGTRQRKMLAKKSTGDGARLPHLLSMTATPIPRTLALTMYGDLDLSLLDELPHGRKPIITHIIRPAERERAYEHMRSELEHGRQAYIICPRIDEPDATTLLALQAKAVTTEAARLRKGPFRHYRIDILHSKMTPRDKDAVMQRFLTHDTDILVATSVIEVGINVPNATVIMIEGAERFGLSQLHQLRGRVMRSSHQAHCFAVTESEGERTIARLKALATAKNGFELAEYDLAQRGSGELYGGKQWGLSDMGMDAIKNLKLVEAARAEARALIAQDPDLSHYHDIKTRVEMTAAHLHLE